MQVFGRDVPSPDDIWQLYSRIVLTPGLWRPETFKEAATQCGLRRIAARQGYFSFSGKHDMTGQAPIAEGFIEEIRLFIGQEPKGLTEALYKKDRGKHAKLASEYSARFEEELGRPRIKNDNGIFECGDHRIRVLPTNCVWVVFSNLSTVKQFPNDWWAADSQNS